LFSTKSSSISALSGLVHVRRGFDHDRSAISSWKTRIARMTSSSIARVRPLQRGTDLGNSDSNEMLFCWRSLSS
jgi:hypothetical protein